MRFFEESERGERREDGDAGQHGEDQAPGAEEQNRCAKRGPDQRRGAEHDGDRGELQARLSALEQVANDRSRQDADRSRARPLHKAEGEQRVNRRGKRRASGAESEYYKAGRHNCLAAEPVRERTDHDRRARKAGAEDGDHRRRLRLGGMKIGLDERQARKRHVDRQRRQGCEQGEKEREPEPVNAESGHRTVAPPPIARSSSLRDARAFVASRLSSCSHRRSRLRVRRPAVVCRRAEWSRLDPRQNGVG